MSVAESKYKFAIDRGGTFTDIWAKCPNGKVKVTKLLSVDPQNYPDAPREGIRRIIEQVTLSFRSTIKLVTLSFRSTIKPVFIKQILNQNCMFKDMCICTFVGPLL
jgi:hypothetical protein